VTKALTVINCFCRT